MRAVAPELFAAHDGLLHEITTIMNPMILAEHGVAVSAHFGQAVNLSVL
jgi:hypothetical protein